ncbi:hypothetical protein F0L17_14695 [Streptomyces sp. TRM43335]|uniref:PASTA domain-containing protein n=1 Tax=Streptomyces taklimakanensis TaxID=2569853 RepID=A0A6G2BE43_9ACTN|nr:PASTA domain-containing protein [Streptomyces taklimakanensis]MTE20333.1 hypothetical protein [Streptomyces taklimakanensis]
MSETAAQRLLRRDSRTAKVAAHESVALPTSGAEALLRALRSGEAVLALYHQGMTGHAALTADALILLGGISASRVTRVPKPLAILRPAHGIRDSVDVSVEGRRVGLWGSELDKEGDLLLRAGELVPDPLAEDPRTAAAAAGESALPTDGQKKALLEALGPDEAVRSFYHDGWNCAALTENGLVLLRGITRPVAVRVPGPLWILRRAHGASGTVEVLVHGRPHKLRGSKLDPKGKLLEAAGEPLPPDSPLRLGRGTRSSAWVGRHPVLVCTVVFAVFLAGLGAVADQGPGPGEKEGAEAVVARGQAEPTGTLTVPSYRGVPLTTAAARAHRHAWRTVSAADASSARRPVKITETGWRVCFQRPSHGETVHPSGMALTLYAVPEREECPRWPGGSSRVVMPDLVGERFGDASQVLGDLDLGRPLPLHAHTGKRLDGESRDPADWRVCRQRPEPDTEVSTTTGVDLWLIGPGNPCAEPSPTPTPKPEPKPKPKPEPRPRPSYGITTGGSTSGGSTGGGSSSGTGSTGGGSFGGSGGSTGARFGQYCSPVGATATTVDGRPAKCFMGKDGRARWGYGSG